MLTTPMVGHAGAQCVSTGCVMLGHGVATPVLPALATELGGAAATWGSLAAWCGAASEPACRGRESVGRAGPRAGAERALGMAASGLAVDVGAHSSPRLVAGAAPCYLVRRLLADVAPRSLRWVLGANHAALLCGISLGPVIEARGGCLGLRPRLSSSPRQMQPQLSMHPSPVTGPAPSGDATTDETMDDDVSSTTLRGTGSPPLETGRRAAARDPQFVSAGIAHAANFAMRQGGRNMLPLVASAALAALAPRADLGDKPEPDPDPGPGCDAPIWLLEW